LRATWQVGSQGETNKWWDAWHGEKDLLTRDRIWVRKQVPISGGWENHRQDEYDVTNAKRGTEVHRCSLRLDSRHRRTEGKKNEKGEVK